MQFRPRRSMLYMPGSNARAMEKARTIAADGIIFDLEDAVAPEMKATARNQIAAAVKAGGYGRREIVVRVNDVTSPFFADDVAAMAPLGFDAIMVPKIGTPADIGVIGTALARHGVPDKTRLWVMTETPLGILNARVIAETAVTQPQHRLSCFVLGTNDIIKETRALLSPDRTALLYALSHCVLAARAFGLDILDSVYNNFRDTAGFRAECQHGRLLGMDGKTLIHPDQVAIANEVFAPPADEVAWSRKILAAFERPDSAGKAAINIDGKMVELLHTEIARRIVAVADAIDALKG